MNFKNRKSIRLSGYDYSQEGAYYITICTQGRLCLFGSVHHGEMVLNEAGKMAEQEWLNTEKIRDNVQIGEFVIMPNHIHGIIIITNRGGVSNTPNTLDKSNVSNIPDALHTSEALNSLNTLNTTEWPIQMDECNSLNQTGECNSVGQSGECNSPLLRGPSNELGAIVRGYKSAVTKWFRQNTHIHTVWQRNYYEHIIRNQNDYDRIAKYILDNPKNYKR